MSTSLQELLKIAGLLADPNAKRPRIADPSQGLHGEIGDGIAATPIAVPPVPASAQAPPRSLPEINPTGEPPPSADTRPRFVDPADNAHNEQIQSFGSSGEPFGSVRDRRTQPRDYVADDLAYARELERQPRNKKLDILTGITQGVASLEGNQPKQPWNFGGRERRLNDVYGRLGKELDVQKEQAQAEALRGQGAYRRQQGTTAQQSAMIRLLNAMDHYTRGEDPQVDAMFDASGMRVPNKPPKAGKGATRKYHPPLYLPDGTAVMYNDVTGQYEDTNYGGAAINNPAMANVVAQGADGQDYTVRPGAALNAAAQTAGRLDTAARSDRQFGQGAYQFESQQQQQRMTRAGDAYDEWVKLDADADSDEAAASALERKRLEQGALYGRDAMDLIGYQSRATARRKQAQAKAEQIRRSHGDFYDVGPDGVPKPKDVQLPTAPTLQPLAPTPSRARPKTAAERDKMFAEDFAAAKTPEERARILKFYQEALQKGK